MNDAELKANVVLKKLFPNDDIEYYNTHFSIKTPPVIVYATLLTCGISIKLYPLYIPTVILVKGILLSQSDTVVIENKSKFDPAGPWIQITVIDPDIVI